MLTAGVDEVGRGPLAGPVVAAAVILKKEIEPKYHLIDSKNSSLDTKGSLPSTLDDIKEKSSLLNKIGK